MHINRRKFLSAASGSAAFTLFKPISVFSDDRHGQPLLTDYVGRLCYNENPLGPSPSAISAIRESATMGHRYPDWFAESLRSDLASLHEVSSSQTIAGCGATEILRLCALAFTDPDGNVVCPYPSYSQFPADAGFLGSSVRYSDLDNDFVVDLDDILSRVNSNTTAVCITNPNNPTATVIAADDLESFVEALPSNVVVIIDEAYHEYVSDSSYQSAIQLVQQGRNVIVIRTFSKVFGMAGIRVGYAIGHSDLISAMSSWHLFATVSRPGLEAAKAALVDRRHIAATVALNEQAKQYCFDNFSSMGLQYIPSQTNFFMVDVGSSASQVAGELAARGIIVRTGWGMPHHLRVSTGTMREMHIFINALNEILNPLRASEISTPKHTSLDGNYPNPFNSATRISYSIALAGRVLIQIFNIRGQLVKTVVDDYMPPGTYSFDWNGTNQNGATVASGSYFYRMTVGDFSQTRRMILLK